MSINDELSEIAVDGVGALGKVHGVCAESQLFMDTLFLRNYFNLSACTHELNREVD